MASFEFDNVKAEKEDALWRYNLEMKLRIAPRFIGFLLLFFLLSWPCFPAFRTAWDFRRCFISTFNKPLFTFIVVNIIIVAVYVLSTKKKTHKQSSTNDIYDEYISSRRSIPASTVVTTAISNSRIAMDKQRVMVENAASISQVKRQPVTVDTVTETKTSLPTVKPQPKKIRAEVKPKQYRRSRSMASESRRERPRERELRSVSSRELGRKSMEEMSNQEFQLIIDRFIAERKKTLMQENTAQEKIKHVRYRGNE
ncbi:CYP722 protein [Hibiscus syriacus]|uniref:CYP722 protein n=1 Tax=Hibiscus syriacus TaxID=106335 RepID=A0A6A3BWX9_HIBSY|nr:uncharacterized protein LOC120211036 [Hibiscus syriacus]KAE8719492.1 CYP722 protein [Hibiscus syriacus]